MGSTGRIRRRDVCAARDNVQRPRHTQTFCIPKKRSGMYDTTSTMERYTAVDARGIRLEHTRRPATNLLESFPSDVHEAAVGVHLDLAHSPVGSRGHYL